MNISQFIASHREEGLQSGDYGAYKAQLSRRLLALRRKLQCICPPSKKAFTQKAVTAEDIGTNHESANCQLHTEGYSADAQPDLLSSLS